jgi:Holliday junction resolvase
MKEENLYSLVKEFLESKEYYPVKTTPVIKIRGYKPDITGLKGKEVLCVEVKPGFNEEYLMQAITQAKVYKFGANYVYVAFPLHSWETGKEDLKELAKKICNEEGTGLYLIDVGKRDIKEEIKAKLSPYLDLSVYESVIEQLEGKKWIRLENTYPEYVRDVCIFIYKLKVPIKKDELKKLLFEKFERNYWLKKSHSPKIRKNPEEAVRNRIEYTIEGAIELGFIEEETEEGLLELSYFGNLLAQLSKEEIDAKKTKPLNEETRGFFSGYLLQFPVIKIAIEILQEEKRILPLGQSFCRKCGFKHYIIEKFKQEKSELFCPRCGSKVETCLVHLLQLRYGKGEYWWPINFTKSLYDSPLIFEFPKVGRLDGIKLKF